MMWAIIGILFSLSLLIWIFLSFSILKQYRYATRFRDLLPIYLYLNLISFILVTIGSSLMISFHWDFPIWTFIILFGVLICAVLMFYIARWRKCYSLKIYAAFLDELTDPIFSVKLFKDYNKQPPQLENDKVNIFIRHDVDLSLSRLQTLTKMEKDRNLFSTLFFRLHSEQYSFSQAIPLIKELHSAGFEIGYHYETLSQTKGNTEEALSLFEEELIEIRKVIPVEVVTHHGDKYKNQQIWPMLDKTALGIWTTFDMKRDIYLTDTGGKDMFRKHGQHIFEMLKKAKPGDVVQILIHADWWY